MNSESNKNLLNIKDYFLLTICLILFFTVGSYLLTGGDIPKDVNFIYIWGAVILIAIPIVIYVLIKLND
tara:strand:- start:1988 stop:2194 length:207 start_codon:yes stop_codon:yes gene_type:complete